MIPGVSVLTGGEPPDAAGLFQHRPGGGESHPGACFELSLTLHSHSPPAECVAVAAEGRTISTFLVAGNVDRVKEYLGLLLQELYDAPANWERPAPVL